jgi:hypothetical protein
MPSESSYKIMVQIMLFSCFEDHQHFKFTLRLLSLAQYKSQVYSKTNDLLHMFIYEKQVAKINLNISNTCS